MVWETRNNEIHIETLYVAKSLSSMPYMCFVLGHHLNCFNRDRWRRNFMKVHALKMWTHYVCPGFQKYYRTLPTQAREIMFSGDWFTRIDILNQFASLNPSCCSPILVQKGECGTLQSINVQFFRVWYAIAQRCFAWLTNIHMIIAQHL